MSRDRILADVRAALARPMPEPADHPHPRWPVAAALPEASLVEWFRDRFVGLGGHWHDWSQGGVRTEIVAFATRVGGAVLVGRERDGAPDRYGIAAALATAGIEVVSPDRAGPDAPRIGLTVTFADFGIAESGTFGMLSRPGQGRLTSVIAPVHLTLLDPTRVVATQGEFLTAAHRALAEGSSSAAILITGPSRTADIEGQLIVGVHGPREVHCVAVVP